MATGSVGRGSASTWTTVPDLVTTLRKRWARGGYLRPYAQGTPFEPISLPVRSPKATDLTARFDEVRAWVERFDADNRTETPRPAFDLDRTNRRTRTIGNLSVPVRAHVPTLERLSSILGTSGELVRLDRVLARTRTSAAVEPVQEALASWVADHPLVAVEHHDVWDGLLAVVGWILDTGNDRSALDPRHLDAPGIDTKFVERHRKILSRLLEQALPADQVDRTATTFAGRFGFRGRSTYVRFRLLDAVPELPAAITELELRVEELSNLPLSVATVFIVENRASYLAFPDIPNAIVVFGEGFGVTVLDGVPWFADCQLAYWGDIDTHGFAILDRLRSRVADVQSILMDHTTLLDHLDHVVSEANPTNTVLRTLTPPEQALYRDLVEDRWGNAVRLEQERIRFASVRDALRPWLGGNRTSPSSTAGSPGSE